MATEPFWTQRLRHDLKAEYGGSGDFRCLLKGAVHVVHSVERRTGVTPTACGVRNTPAQPDWGHITTLGRSQRTGEEEPRGNST
jgi:hypothetical protein